MKDRVEAFSGTIVEEVANKVEAKKAGAAGVEGETTHAPEDSESGDKTSESKLKDGAKDSETAGDVDVEM